MEVLSKVPGFCNGKGLFEVKRKAYVPVLLTSNIREEYATRKQYLFLSLDLKGNSGAKMKLFCIVGLYFLRQYLVTISIDRWSECRYFTLKTTKKHE